METYLFYTTHLIMGACIAVIAVAGKPEIIQAAVKWFLFKYTVITKIAL